MCVWKHRAERSHGILKKANLDFLTLLVLLSSVNRFQEFQSFHEALQFYPDNDCRDLKKRSQVSPCFHSTSFHAHIMQPGCHCRIPSEVTWAFSPNHLIFDNWTIASVTQFLKVSARMECLVLGWATDTISMFCLK